jgi:hypothetical protein
MQQERSRANAGAHLILLAHVSPKARFGAFDWCQTEGERLKEFGANARANRLRTGWGSARVLRGYVGTMA